MQRILLLVAWLSGCCLTLNAQSGQYDVRFVTETVECASDFVFIGLEIKASNAQQLFNLGHLNVRFTFNDQAVTNPIIADEGELSGLATTASPQSFTFFQPHTLTGSAANLVSYNVFMGGGTGYPLNENDWVRIGTVRFSILDPSACMDLAFNTEDPTSFPNTTIIERFNNFFYPVLPGQFVNTPVCLAEYCVPPPAIPSFDLRFIRTEVNCSDDKVFVELQIKATNVNSSFNLAFMNLRFKYNGLAISNPVLEQELAFSGLVTTTNPPTFSFYSPHTITGSTGNQVSYNVFLAGGDGFPVPQEWTAFGLLSFDILDYTQCMLLDWNEFDEFPNSLVIEKEQQTFSMVTEGNFEPANLCRLGAQCQEFRNATLDPIQGVELMPVPVNQFLTVQLENVEAKQTNVSIFDLQGRRIHFEQMSLQTGTNQFLIDLNQQAAGMYMLLLEAGDYRYTELFSKVNP
ncbi:MAG: T9SS type A sorting domain-containing protein [Bacteroidota bacterium]